MWPGRGEVGELRARGRDGALWTNIPPCLRSRPPEGQWEGPGGHSAPVQSPSASRGRPAHSLKTVSGRRVLSHFPSQISCHHFPLGGWGAHLSSVRPGFQRDEALSSQSPWVSLYLDYGLGTIKSLLPDVQNWVPTWGENRGGSGLSQRVGPAPMPGLGLPHPWRG